MQLDAFILADAVATPPDGKFYVQGGGLSRVEIPTLPFPLELSVLIRLLVGDDDLEASHLLRLALIGPTGQPNIPPMELTAHPPGAVDALLPGEQRYIHIGADVRGVAVRVGEYRVELHINDKLAGSIPFPVVTIDGEPPVLPPERVVRANRATQKRPPPPPKKKAKQRARGSR